MKAAGLYRLEYEYEFQCNNNECAASASFAVRVDIRGYDPLKPDDEMRRDIDPDTVECTSMAPPPSGMGLPPLLHPDDQEPASNQYDTQTIVPPDPAYGRCPPQRVMRRLVVNAADLNEDDRRFNRGDEIYLRITLSGPTKDVKDTNVVEGNF
jgi:hypothetical protein